MPYGVDKNIGGDSPSNTKFMEKCVESVMKTGKNKESAVAICKAQLKKNSKSNLLDFTEIDEDIIINFYNLKDAYIRKQMESGLTYKQAESKFETDLSRGNVKFV